MEPSAKSLRNRWAPGLIARRPAVAAVLLIIAGICLAFAIPDCPWIYLSIVALGAVAGAALRRFAVISCALVAVALASLGVVVAQAEFYRYAGDDIGAFSSTREKLVQLELRVDEAPRIAGGGGRGTPRQMFEASAQRILTRAGWTRVSGTILVQATHPHPFLSQGQVLRVLGMLQRPVHATNPGEFDRADYYRGERILTSIKIGRISNIQILGDDGPGVTGWMQGWARDLLAMGFTDKHAGDHAMLRALVLGDSDPMMRESQKQFLNIGVAFLLSVSGMHITVVIACIYAICRLLMRSPRFACWLCLAVVLAFWMVDAPRLSALRATLLCAAVLFGILNRRDIEKLQLLSLVAAALLLLRPLELFNAGFQLGFPCIAGLILLPPPMQRWLAAWDRRDADSRREVRGRLWWRAWFVLRTWLVFSLAAWMVTMPIVAFHFGHLSPWVIPCGIVLFPVVAAALLAGCAKIALTLVWPGAASWWAMGAAGPITLMRHMGAELSRGCVTLSAGLADHN